LVKNPDNGGYALFFNAGFYKKSDYHIEYATAPNIKGPYQRQGALLQTGTYQGIKVTAPGGADFVGNSSTEMVFMAWKTDVYGIRQMHAAELDYKGNNITLSGGSG